MARRATLCPAGMASRAVTGRPSMRSSDPAGKRDARDGDVIRGMKMDGGILGASGAWRYPNSMGLSFSCSSGIVAEMHVELVAGRVDQQAVADRARTGIPAGPSTTRTGTDSSTPSARSLPMWMWEWHWVRRSVPFMARPQCVAEHLAGFGDGEGPVRGRSAASWCGDPAVFAVHARAAPASGSACWDWRPSAGNTGRQRAALRRLCRASIRGRPWSRDVPDRTGSPGCRHDQPGG